MKKLNYVINILLVLVVVSSCKKALEVDPISTITSASFFKTQDDITGALRGMYYNLRLSATSDMFFLGEGRSEVLTSAAAGTTGLDKYYKNTLTVSNPGPNWMSFYTTINSANLILKYAPNITFTSEAAKNNALAEAYTMRAFNYFVLVRSWGGVPIRTEPTESYDPATIQIARSSVADVFKLIKSDLDKALSLYAGNTPSASRSSWSKPAANALKADVYLWTGKVLNGGTADFTTALNALNDISSSDFTLLPSYSDIFSYTNKGNKEVLMSVRFQLLDVPANTGFNYWMNMAVRVISNVSPTTLAAIGTLASSPAENIMQIAPAVRSQFTTDDQRRNGTFYEIYDNSNNYVTSITTKGNGVVSSGVRSFYTDVMIYRYAEVLLLKAEAKNALGQDPSAEINQVRQRAYGSNYSSHVFVNGTQAQNDAAILKERLLELATEGKRWWDLIRFGQVFNLVPSMQGKSADLLLFPIGVTIRSLEPLVTENPGWQ
ncbi:RagB/SusD family nutrient uptake outer membrane protein [Flavisolibacter ginsenosidimutans]|uniref:RagB/SusD family nutrient uptake outer membrane protein n=1 Tax=Flavisolibacter ginsenosidimutans TaxID=661481 RepID=A0A5B8UE44_9BACT|nr:RagB/SusD family nutrient uptake outer membrane protein [Flavisolibacter ginsenosidimutans]QEC54399.1 RagB/SusD family nutrient uptake outer membrane protein [Flavisolibacter ginsenosidimutans]